MIQRTYHCLLSNDLDAPYYDLDILVCGPVGTKALPVKATGGTTPPAGWAAACGSGAFYEFRSRTLRVEPRSGAAGFSPRFNLGWNCSIYPYGNSDSGNGALDTNKVPVIVFSQSLTGSLLSTAMGSGMSLLPDPSYGPVIRLGNGADLAGGQFIVHLNIFDAREEDNRRP